MTCGWLGFLPLQVAQIYICGYCRCGLVCGQRLLMTIVETCFPWYWDGYIPPYDRGVRAKPRGHIHRAYIPFVKTRQGDGPRRDVRQGPDTPFLDLGGSRSTFHGDVLASRWFTVRSERLTTLIRDPCRPKPRRRQPFVLPAALPIQK